jgi:branched-chain amino acid transport system ATP-binding protein
MAQPLLQLDSISKSFGQVIVAADLSVQVEPGSTLGIVGPNGAGKSSLFAMVAGDLRPDSGDVILNGQRVTAMGSAARCRLGIGRTYQIPRPFEGMTVFENVLVASQQGGGMHGKPAHEATLAALRETGLRGQANQPAGRLGLLARKRLEVARAIATRPSLLLLDEVAGGLTDPEVAELVQIVRDVNGRGVAVIWIEHVVRALLSTVDRMLCLAGGSVIGDGNPREVLAQQRVKEIFLGTEVTAVSAALADDGDDTVHAEDGSAPDTDA